MISDSIRWNTQLIQRYDIAGPRYTSYPTALQFNNLSSFELIRALRESREAKRPLSFYIHVPFCANICYYCGCNKVITKDRTQAQPYVERLIQEIKLVSQYLGSDQVVEQIHFGGGTPTFLTTEQIGHIIDALRSHFPLADNLSGDFSIEIDPREADWTVMGLLRDQGFNRISLGVQDFDPDVQRAVNRLQTFEQTQAIIEAAHALQFKSINVDLIYGLPKQSPSKFAETVRAVIDLQPDRLSVFNYAHLPERFKPQRRISVDDLPSPAQKLQILQETITQLTEAGYRYIGMDHFALQDDDLTYAQEEGTLYRNFQGYTTHGYCDLIGLGVSSISQIGDLYCQNTADLNAYQASIDVGQLATKRGLICNQDDRIRRAVIQQLICHLYLDFRTIENEYHIVLKDYFNDVFNRLKLMEKDGLIIIGEHDITVQSTGRLLIRTICMLFDNYLAEQAAGRFSRVI